MNNFGIIDFRDEFYVKLLRGWTTISLLNQNTKFKYGVPIGKAALADFLLCNPTIYSKLLASFGRTQQSLHIDDFLYQDNIEFGSLQDLKDFSRTCSLLIRAEHLSFERIEGEVILRSLRSPPINETGLIQRWRMEIDQILPLMGKSLNVLHNAILNASNGN